MQTYPMEVTPAQALEFLALNRSNRPLRPSWIRTLVGIIERGEWKLTHQGIAISSANELLDGQHRLHAIVAAGRTVQMQVSFDCDQSSFLVLDGGLKRTVQDQLRIPRVHGSIARLLWRLPNRQRGLVASSAQIAEVLSWAQGPITEVCDTVGSTRTKFTSMPILSAATIHVMAGNNVLHGLKALSTLNFGEMSPALHSFSRQVVERRASAAMNNGWDLMARAWRSLMPSAQDVIKVQIKNLELPFEEMARVLQTYRVARSGMRLMAAE